jgi:hypothetical protein
MTRYLDVRLDAVGGNLATFVATNQGTSIDNYQSLDINQLRNDIRGQHVLIGTHGFHVNRATGIACLSNWEAPLQLTPPSISLACSGRATRFGPRALIIPKSPRLPTTRVRLSLPFSMLILGMPQASLLPLTVLALVLSCSQFPI